MIHGNPIIPSERLAANYQNLKVKFVLIICVANFMQYSTYSTAQEVPYVSIATMIIIPNYISSHACILYANEFSQSFVAQTRDSYIPIRAAFK